MAKVVRGGVMVTGNFEKSSVFGKGVRPSKTFQLNDQLRRDIYAEIRKLNSKSILESEREERVCHGWPPEAGKLVHQWHTYSRALWRG